MRIFFLLCFMLMPRWGLAAQGDGISYGWDSRVTYVRQVLRALAESDSVALANTLRYIHVIDQNRCRSAFSDLRTNCLLAAARRACRQAKGGAAARSRCRLVSDVVVTNKLAQQRFIPAATRYAIMSQEKDYRLGVRRELRRRYAELALDYYFARHEDQDQAASMDAYCLGQARKQGLSWQYCVAALTWFVQTHDKVTDTMGPGRQP